MSAAFTGTAIPFGCLEPAAFQSRPNRYLAWVLLDGASVAAHVSDPGRMKELLVPGRQVYVRRVERISERKTVYDLVLVDYDGVLVSIDTLVPNRLVRQALQAGLFPAFKGYTAVRAEVRHGKSRFDFQLSGPPGDCVVEVKSVGWMRDGIGWFPDAVTARGARHMDELAKLRRKGTRTAVIFVAQRSDLREIRVDSEVDPEFARALRRAAEAGVEVYGWRCAVTLTGVRLDCEVPVLLPESR